MTRYSASSFVLLLVVSLGIWAAIAALCLLVGSTAIGWPGDLFWSRGEIVLQASVVGAGLAAAGVAYQAVLRNGLADPYLLGVASGATLGGMLWRLPAFAMVPVLSAAGQQVSALVGALAAVAAVFAVSTRRGRLEPVTLLLTGVIVSALCGAVLLVLVSIYPELMASEGGAASILVGNLQSNLSQVHKWVGAAVVGVGTVLLVLLAPSLAVGTLSDAEAESLGVRVNRLRWLALGAASIVVAAAVSMSGPIGFVGLIGPHVARLLVGPDPRRHLPVAVALGAALLAGADGICRLLAQQSLLGILLPVGVITAMLGGPFFLTLMVRERGASNA